MQILHFQVPQRRFNLEVYGINCSNHTSLVKRLDCEVHKVANSHYSFASNFMTNKQLYKDCEIRAIIEIQMAKSSIKYKFIDLKMSLCEALSTAMSMPLAKELFDEARRTSNLPYACPMKQVSCSYWFFGQ